MTDEEFSLAVLEILRLVEGLPSAHHVCACRRVYRVGISEQLAAAVERVRGETLRRSGKADCVPETTRFGLIEVDE